MSYENKLCYFCDEPFPYPSSFIENYNGIFICYGCEMVIPINNIEQNGECCVCLEDKHLIKLPTCIHKVCFECCKTIYFGSTPNERPIHWREMNVKSPCWPYDVNDYDERDPENIKYEQYCKQYDDFETKYFNIEQKSYDELIEIRDNLIPERPDWMNTEEFINYENDSFMYHTNFVKLEKELEKYNENKTKGNSSCPLCRAKLYP
jgi:hypothetical protein